MLDDKIFTWQGTKITTSIDESDSLLAPRPLRCFEELLKGVAAKPGTTVHGEEALIDNMRPTGDDYAQAKKFKLKLQVQKRAFTHKVLPSTSAPFSLPFPQNHFRFVDLASSV